MILSSFNHTHVTGIVTTSLSDHYPTFLIKKMVLVQQEKISFQGRRYRDLDVDQFNRYLRSYNWGRFFAAMEVDLAWNELFSVILAASYEFCPLKTFHIKKKRPPWFNDDMVELAANRDDFYGRGKKNKDDASWALGFGPWALCLGFWFVQGLGSPEYAIKFMFGILKSEVVTPRPLVFVAY